MRYRDSREHASLMNPGQTYQVTLDLWSTSNVFLRGHRLRLEISSSNFPRFDRNLNTGEDIKFARRFVSATNTIFHDAQHPSALVLPVIPVVVPDFQMSAGNARETVNTGETTTDTLSIASLQGFTGTVSLSCTGTTGLTCSLSPASVTASTTAPVTSTLTVSASTSANSGSITITGISGTVTHTLQIPIVVPNFTLTASGSVVSIPSGGTITDNLTVTPTGGGFNSDVALTCSVPSSLGTTTCTISPATVTGGSGTALLTLKGAVLGMDRGAPRPFQHRGLGLYATLVFALGMVFTGNPLRGRRARRASRNAFLGLLLSCVTFGAVSCGGGGGSGSSGSNPTPLSGNVTITATSESVTHTATINVTVQ
jgi:hypothetical protein